MGDRVSGKIRMGDRWVGYKRRKKWAWERILERENLKCLGEFFGEKILDVWESFGRLKKILRERKYQKRENFEDDGSLKLGVIITNSFIDQYKSRVHPRQRASKFELSVFIYSFIYGFTRKLAQIVYTFSISFFFHILCQEKDIFTSTAKISSRCKNRPRQAPKLSTDFSTDLWLKVPLNSKETLYIGNIESENQL